MIFLTKSNTAVALHVSLFLHAMNHAHSEQFSTPILHLSSEFYCILSYMPDAKCYSTRMTVIPPVEWFNCFAIISVPTHVSETPCNKTREPCT